MLDIKRINAMNFSSCLNGFAKISKELDKLIILINSQFPDYLNNKDEQIKSEVYGESSKVYDELSDWFANEYISSFTILPKNNRTKGIGYVNFNIALSGKAVSQYDEGVEEPLLHVEFSVEEPYLENFMHHPIKRSNYGDVVNNISLIVENNTVSIFSNSKCVGILYSVRLFDINESNIEALLYEPMRKLILKHLFVGSDIGDIYIPGNSLISIPQPNFITGEIETSQNSSLLKAISYVSGRTEFTFNELHDYLRVGSKMVSYILERMISAGILVDLTNDVFELKIQNEQELKRILF
ncbi:TPA: hypothetical protein PC598_003113 [Morganella morganii]|nr:hypothetical protein [Morganella morganii]